MNALRQHSARTRMRGYDLIRDKATCLYFSCTRYTSDDKAPISILNGERTRSHQFCLCAHRSRSFVCPTWETLGVSHYLRENSKHTPRTLSNRQSDVNAHRMVWETRKQLAPLCAPITIHYKLNPFNPHRSTLALQRRAQRIRDGQSISAEITVRPQRLKEQLARGAEAAEEIINELCASA